MVLTYANQLTILRMIFIPCFVLLLIYDHPKLAILVFILAGITDGLDGLLARKFQQKTVLGSFLDPMADKLLLTSAFLTLTVPAVPVAYHVPVWLTVTSISRDLLIALAALIIHARQELDPGRSLGMDFPARQSSSAIERAGFRPRQTLIWMRLELAA